MIGNRQALLPLVRGTSISGTGKLAVANSLSSTATPGVGAILTLILVFADLSAWTRDWAS